MNKDEYIQELEELLLDSLTQACLDDDGITIDNMCMSTYERTCDYFHKKGKIIKINDRMYKLKRGFYE